MKNIKSRKIILFILVLSIIIVIGLLISKFTTAYFAPSLGDDVVKRGEVTATGDNIIFTSGNSLSISATTDNFTTGG